MDSEFGLIGGGWQDYHDKQIKPLLDQIDQQMRGILASGAHGEIAQMQAHDDALGGDGSIGTGVAAPDLSNAGLISLSGISGGRGRQTNFPLSSQDTGSVNSYGYDSNFSPAHLTLGQSAPIQRSPDSAALLSTSAYPQTVNLQDVAVPSVSRFVIRDMGSGNLNPVVNGNSGAQNGAPGDDVYGRVAAGFKGGGLAADTAATVASKVGALGSGDRAVLQGLEGVTRRVISRPFAIAEGAADIAKDIRDGASPAEAIVGNAVRTGIIYGAGALAGGLPGIGVGLGLDYVLPNGAVIGHAVMNPNLPPNFDPSLFQPF
jgi:hypothetical protein